MADTERNGTQRKHRIEGLRRRTLNFTPSWFSVNMGTGIVSILLKRLPFQFAGLGIIADCVFVLNVCLFVFFLGISIARYAIWPQIFKAMIMHSQQSLFLGTFPMGLSTIISMIVYVCVPVWGPAWIYLAWSLWWIDVAISLLTCYGLIFILFVYHMQKMENMTALWLLPVVAPIVASSTGSVVATVLPQSYASLTIVVSYIIFGSGFFIAMLILGIYLHRLSLHSIPESQIIVSVFLPLGPMGQGSYAIMQLATDVRQLALEGALDNIIGPTSTLVSTSARSLAMADALYLTTLAIALVIWGFGLFWLVIACLSILKTKKFPFNMGWWGFTFPLGTMAVAANTFGEESQSFAFKIIGTILSLIVVFMWVFISCRTTMKAIEGTMYVGVPELTNSRFLAPCLSQVTNIDSRSEDRER